jgi:hypothetical protein
MDGQGRDGDVLTGKSLFGIRPQRAVARHASRPQEGCGEARGVVLMAKTDINCGLLQPGDALWAKKRS